MAKKTNAEVLKGAKSNFNWSLASGIASGVASLATGVLGYSTAKRYGRMQQRAAETQARLNTIATERNIGYQTRQAADAIGDIKRQGRQVVGSQLAAMAASGMSTASGSAQALLKSTGVSVGRDVSTIQANLQNSAFEQRRATAIENIGLQYKGQEAYAEARQQANASLIGGFQGLLSAATSVADKWQKYQDLRTEYETPKTNAYSAGLSNSQNVDKNLGYQYDDLNGKGYSYLYASGKANAVPNFYEFGLRGRKK